MIALHSAHPPRHLSDWGDPFPGKQNWPYTPFVDSSLVPLDHEDPTQNYQEHWGAPTVGHWTMADRIRARDQNGLEEPYPGKPLSLPNPGFPLPLAGQAPRPPRWDEVGSFEHGVTDPVPWHRAFAYLFRLKSCKLYYLLKIKETPPETWDPADPGYPGDPSWKTDSNYPRDCTIQNSMELRAGRTDISGNLAALPQLLAQVDEKGNVFSDSYYINQDGADAQFLYHSKSPTHNYIHGRPPSVNFYEITAQDREHDNEFTAELNDARQENRLPDFGHLAGITTHRGFLRYYAAHDKGWYNGEIPMLDPDGNPITEPIFDDMGNQIGEELVMAHKVVYQEAPYTDRATKSRIAIDLDFAILDTLENAITAGEFVNDFSGSLKIIPKTEANLELFEDGTNDFIDGELDFFGLKVPLVGIHPRTHYHPDSAVQNTAIPGETKIEITLKEPEFYPTP